MLGVGIGSVASVGVLNTVGDNPSGMEWHGGVSVSAESGFDHGDATISAHVTNHTDSRIDSTVYVDTKRLGTVSIPTRIAAPGETVEGGYSSTRMETKPVVEAVRVSVEKV